MIELRTIRRFESHFKRHGAVFTQSFMDLGATYQDDIVVAQITREQLASLEQEFNLHWYQDDLYQITCPVIGYTTGAIKWSESASTKNSSE